MKTILTNTENSKTNELYEFALKLSQRLDLRSSTNLSNLSFFKTYLYITRGKI